MKGKQTLSLNGFDLFIRVGKTNSEGNIYVIWPFGSLAITLVNKKAYLFTTIHQDKPLLMLLGAPLLTLSLIITSSCGYMLFYAIGPNPHHKSPSILLPYLMSSL